MTTQGGHEGAIDPLNPTASRTLTKSYPYKKELSDVILN